MIDEALPSVRSLAKNRLPGAAATDVTLVGSDRILELLPHRKSALLVDRVCSLDREAGVVVGTYDLDGSREILSGHFPGDPIWPGVLHVEAIGQLGILGVSLTTPLEPEETPVLTEVTGARFVRPARSPGVVTICARFVRDGLFFAIAGQTLAYNGICAAAAIRGIGAEKTG